MKITVIGTGYVGLVSGVCLASRGHRVVCIDLKPEIIESLNAGRPTIYERGLEALLTEVRAKGLFAVSDDLPAHLADTDVAMIAVGTPSVDGAMDLSQVLGAATAIGGFLRDSVRPLSVIVKSTVLPGTTDGPVRRAIEQGSGKPMGQQWGLGMNPEFLREGEAIDDFIHPDRIVLGAEDEATRQRLREMYAPWATVEKIETNTRTAELIKYANNALLATQISAINEIANLASRLGGIDFGEVVHGVTADKRWSPLTPAGRVRPGIVDYLVPGCGFGGSCFPKDVQALRTQGHTLNQPMQILEAVLEVNARQPGEVIRLLRQALPVLEGRPVTVLGLAFKPCTDDVRESASAGMINDLLAAGVQVSAHDPIAGKHFLRANPGLAERIQLVEDWQQAITGAAAIIVATRWPEYTDLPAHTHQGQIIVDPRHMFAPADFKPARYLTVGST